MKAFNKILERMMKMIRLLNSLPEFGGNKIAADLIVRNRDSDLGLLVQILLSPAGSEELLPNDFSTHLALIILLLKILMEEKGRKYLWCGSVGCFLLYFQKGSFSGQKHNTFE